jgi:DNA transformation protein
MAISKEFADYCCELLASIGPVTAKRMFGGWGISAQGMSVAWLVDLSDKGACPNERLYLKADNDTRAIYEAAGCLRFAYDVKGVQKTVNYYAAPDEAMESAELMRPWAQLALQCALKAKVAKPSKPKKPKSAKRSSHESVD